MTSHRIQLPRDPIPLDDDMRIPELYAKIGNEFPERIFARILTEEKDGQARLEDITWGRLLRDSTIAANLLLGFGIPRRSGNAPQTVVAILATSSYAYYTYLVGVWLNGWTPLLLSTRNSVPAIQHLICSVNAQFILVDDATSGVKDHLKHMPDLVFMDLYQSQLNVYNGYAPNLQCVILPGIETCTKFDEAALYMHTSGSQGHPKPVPTTHRHFITGCRVRSAQRYAGSPVYAPLPLFHGMGIYAFTQWPIGSGVVPTFVSMTKPVNIEVVTHHLQHLPGAIVFLAPALLEDVEADEQVKITSLASAERIFYGGAPLKESVGNSLVSKGVSIANSFGMTEISLISVLDLPSEDLLSDWSYVRFREDMYKLHFLPVDQPDVRELVVSRGRICTPSVLNHELGFTTGDLWAPHPKIKDLWKHAGRKDGVTVLSTGEKTDNRQLESLLTQDPRISYAVVFGSGKPLNGVIISPSSQAGISLAGDIEPDLFRETVWNTIVKVNGIIPTHSRLIHRMVLVENCCKPFVTTDKGTVRSRETLALYEREIADAYSTLDNGTECSSGFGAKFEPEEVKNAVRYIVQKVCGRTMRDNTDIFDSGADSLHALQIRAELLPLIKCAPSPTPTAVPQSLVYTHPTISQLASFTLDCIKGKGPPGLLDNTKTTRVEDCIRRFSIGRDRDNTFTVLLTGSTGSLGCHVLNHLLCRPDIRRIHCLMRGDASINRQKIAFANRSLDLLSHETKLKVHSADLSKPNLALSSETLNVIKEEVTHIFHLAWELNFNWPLEKFEKDHIAGVRHLIDLACSSSRSTPPKLVFSSSIGAVGNYGSSCRVPEQALDDPTVSTHTGYGEAKYVAEQLIGCASRELGMPATIIRCGQLSGSTVDGGWTRTEFVPLLFKSSLSLGLFPETMPPVRWLPVDISAQCFIDLALHDTYGLTYYHMENTESTSWSEILQMFLAVVGDTIRPVPTTEWLAAVEETASTFDGLPIPAAPAVFLLEFFSQLAAASNSWRSLDATVASQVSPRMRYGKVTMELMNKYVCGITDS